MPDRDIILALTADEEGGKLERRRLAAEESSRSDRCGICAESGLAERCRTDKPPAVEFEATEKLYADYQVLATNPGGHSSLPKPDNAIYHVADALAALQKSPFPFELNAVTREYFTQMATIETGQVAADMRAILAIRRPTRRPSRACRRIRPATRPCAPPASRRC